MALSTLPLPDGTNYAWASGIAVSGTDVYVTGYEYIGNLANARCWKNGNVVPLQLADNTNLPTPGQLLFQKLMFM